MDVFCFDFDGVICDSAPETALTAWLGCQELWPGTAAELPPELLERFCRLRPVMHTGFEAIPLMRLIQLGKHDDSKLLTDFPALRDALIERERLRHEALQQRFGAIRDRLIAEDEARWLHLNRFYPGAAELLAAALAAHPVYIITTKQERFAALLCRHHGVELPDERIHGLERGLGKAQILAELQEEPAFGGATFHFIEDRLDTLLDALAVPALSDVRLYLADWGYNTPAQREQAAQTKRIQVVSLAQFRDLYGL